MAATTENWHAHTDKVRVICVDHTLIFECEEKSAHHSGDTWELERQVTLDWHLKGFALRLKGSRYLNDDCDNYDLYAFRDSEERGKHFVPPSAMASYLTAEERSTLRSAVDEMDAWRESHPEMKELASWLVYLIAPVSQSGREGAQ